jgi:hypothetical protein
MFKRIGGLQLDIPYTQPEVSPGAGRVPNMLLLVDPTLSPSIVIRENLTGVRAELIIKFLTEYYLAVEGPDYNDSEFHRLTVAARRRRIIPLLPLSG